MILAIGASKADVRDRQQWVRYRAYRHSPQKSAKTGNSNGEMGDTTRTFNANELGGRRREKFVGSLSFLN